MTYQLDPKRSADDVDHNTRIRWTPVIFALVFAALLGFLMFDSLSGPPSSQSVVSRRSELPNTAPSATATTKQQ
jgi:hypothetical protein